MGQLFDNFERPDTTSGLGTAPTGHVWDTTYADVKITGGRVIIKYPPGAGTQTAYNRVNLEHTARKVSSKVSYNVGAPSPDATFAMIISHGIGGDLGGVPNGAYANMIHFVFWDVGWTLNVYENSVPGATLASGLIALAHDETVYQYAIEYEPADSSVTVFQPNGTTKKTINAAFARVAGPKLVYQQYTNNALAQTSFPRLEEVEATEQQGAEFATQQGSTLAEIRRDIAVKLKNYRRLIATEAGSTSTFKDIERGREDVDYFRGAQAYFSAGSFLNIGQTRRIAGNTLTDYTITLSPPALPAATAIGDIVEVYNQSGKKWTKDEVDAEINHSLANAYPNYRVPATAILSPVYDQDDVIIPIPWTLRDICGVQFEDSLGIWQDIRQAPHPGGRGWWVDPFDRKLGLGGEFKAAAHNLTLRATGYGKPAPLLFDNDVTLIDREWLVEQTIAQLRMSNASEQNMAYGQYRKNVADSLRAKMVMLSGPYCVHVRD